MVNQGESPSLIEPVTGSVRLLGLQGAKSVTATALGGAGRAIGEAIPARQAGAVWTSPSAIPLRPGI